MDKFSASTALRRFGRHWRYVVGDTWHAGNAAFYSADRPSALFANGGYRGNPWVTPEKLKESGAVLVWDAQEDGVDIPPDLAVQPAAEDFSPPQRIGL